MIKNITKNPSLLSVTASFFILLFVFIFSFTDIFSLINKNILSLYFSYKGNNTINNIVVVEIDEDTLVGRKLPNGVVTKEGLGRFPFDRKYYAKVIDNLTNAGASVIAFDVIFGEASNEESDNLMSESIKKSGRVILGSWPNYKKINSNLEMELMYPYNKFGDYALTKGFFSVDVSKGSDIVYGLEAFKKFSNLDSLYNHFSIAILRGFYSKIYNDNSYLTDNFISYDNRYELKKIKLLKSRKNSDYILVNYVKDNNYFYRKSFLDIYNGDFNINEVKDKIVLIGATAEGIKDIFDTPKGSMYGVYIHTNMINTIVKNNGIVYLNPFLEWFLIFLLIIISFYFNLSRSSIILIFSNISIISIFLLFLTYIVLRTNYILNHIFEFISALFISLVVSNILKYYIENKNKDKLNKALSEYVSEDVAKEILSGEGLVNLDGEKKEIVIFFSDIEGFTSISEKLSPEELVSFLRDYLGSMSQLIKDEKGYVDKFEGDAIMALWGVFGKDGVETYRACSISLKQQEVLNKVILKWNKYPFMNIKVRIGIHFGDAVVGDIGSEGGKKNFTALGDNVNLASRLEGVNKFYGTYICVSETVFEKEKDNFEFRYLDKIRVKGKENPVKIYELINSKLNLTEEQKEMLFAYRIASNMYVNGQFEEALINFTAVAEKWNDNPSKVYKDRCEFYVSNPPGDSWDGVWTMTSK